MATIKNVFTGGKMSMDVDERLLKKGEYRYAKNIRIANSEGSDVGAIEKSLSNRQLTNLNLGTNVKTIGGTSDEFEEKLYWLVKSDAGSYLIEYNTINNAVDFVLKDTRIGTENVLALNENYRITGIILVIDSDNNNTFIIFTDNNTQPKCVNIKRAKTYGENGFNEEMILLIKKPPIDAPKITLGNTISNEENNMEEIFLIFGYRYKYLDGEYSAISPLSETAFKPKAFNYNYATSTNDSMINSYNKVNIEINSGSKLVTDIEVVFIESGKNIPYLVDRYNKKNKGWNDNSYYSVSFSNNKVYKNLPEKQLFRLFDNVPLKAKALAVLDNRIVFGNYTEGYNIVDVNNNKIDINLNLDYNSFPIKDGIGKRSCKSNRDLEVAIGYLDNYGRITTPLISENNTTYIKNANSITQNKLQLTIKNPPPFFAKYYRAYIKQSKSIYNILPLTLFYEQGSFRWVKIEQADKDKIKEGDYLIVKSAKEEILSAFTKVKVLEIKKQERNFLQTKETNDVKELEGLYFKIQPKNFRLNLDDFQTFEIETYHNARRKYHNCIIDSVANVREAHFYGDTLNDLTTGETCLLPDKTIKRFLVQIDTIGDGTNTFNTFKWSIDNGANWKAKKIVITAGQPQMLSDGVTITFNANTGHSLNDKWEFSANGRLYSYKERAYGFFRTAGELYKTMTDNNEGRESETIESGAVISLKYDEYNVGNVSFDLSGLISSREYDNIEEWFYKENIGAKILEKVPNFDLSRIYFMRGVLGKFGGGAANTLTYNANSYMTMIIESQREQSAMKWVKVKAKTTLFQYEGGDRIIFETEPERNNSDIFYEIGRTYKIENGYHLGYNEDDTSQTHTTNAVLQLPFFNCFTWGNGFESVRIKDLFNSNTLSINTRPSVPIENYRQNKRIASLTYGKKYEQSLNYNGLNEFNMSELNFKDLDDKYGAIQTIMGYNTNLDVWQEDKVHQVLYNKSVLYNQDGSSNVGKSNLILDAVIPYAGEFGISTHPESLVAWGNYRFWTDAKRGVFLRKGQSGIEVISKNGMRDWFRDYFRNNLKAINLCAYDPYYNQVVLGLNKEHTLTFDEQVKGFTSFHSFIPDLMLRLNNRFFTIKAGQLYLHNEEGNGYNNFYGEQFSSKITTIFNDEHSHDKIYKTLVLEGTNSWRVDLKTNYTESHIKPEEFNKRESRWFAYMRKNENTDDLHGVSQGLGVIQAVNGLEITVHEIPQNVSVGDEVWQVLSDDTMQQIGIIENYYDNVVVLENSSIPPQKNAFCFSKKDSRIEGGEMRGYYLEVTLTDDTNEKNELFAISSEVVKSYL